MGRLTPNEAVTAAFISFVGNSTFNGMTALFASFSPNLVVVLVGQTKEVSMDQTCQRPAPEPLNKAVVDNIAELGETHRVAYLRPGV